jgi:integrase/recombinase XerD
MNRSSPGLLISKSIDSFLKFKIAEGLSQRTVDSYEHILNHWLKYIGDKPVTEINPSELTSYMAWLRTNYKPVRFNGSTVPLSPESVRNVWVTFRSFFGWLHLEFKYPNPAQKSQLPSSRKAL